ncbi:MAG: class I SAM-dependent methyltransferase [Acholeplasmataceae bacterium]|nr:class I SAM-dependent methyltransferase [Acholeplasmataceae bacterium]
MFAKVYDILMSDVDYDAIYQQIKLYLKKEDTIIDAGCGSGYLLLELLRHDHYAIGFDHDTEMLSIAFDRLRTNQFAAGLYEHDLRNKIYTSADVILAMFDVMNYFKGIKKVFQNIYQALNQGGRFIFDIYKYEVLDEYHQYEEKETEPITYEWSIISKGEMLHHKVKVLDETDFIKQYVYPLDYYLDELKTIGFTYEVKDSIDSRKHLIIAFK